MPRYYQRTRPRSTTPPPKRLPQTGPSNLYKDYLAKRAAEQAQAQAEGQRRAQEAQRRRAQAEQDARTKQYQADVEAARRQERTNALSKARLERRRDHRVSRTDTPESIAQQYGTTPQSVVNRAGVSRLRAGQIIPVYQPFEGLQQATVEPKASNQMADLSAYNSQRREQATQGQRQYPNFQLPGSTAFTSPEMLEARIQLEQNIPESQRLYPDQGFAVDQDRLVGGEAVALPQERGLGGAEQDMWQRNPEAVRAAQREKWLQGNYEKQLTIRWTGQAVQYVYGMIESGQLDLIEGRNIFRNTVMKKQADGSYTYELGDKWMTFTTSEFLELPESTQMQLLGLGWQPNGLGQVVPIQLEDEGFGMGGYEYDGSYGYGGGGGGGGYTPAETKPRTGNRFRRDSGGTYSVRRGQLQAGSVPPAHWRI
jgi:hypothetical protein